MPRKVLDMRHLPIYRMGRIIGHAKLDDADYEWAKNYRWYIQTRGSGGKPQVTRYDHSTGTTQNVFLSREIMGIDSSSVKEVYPLDGDPYNLQGDNLAVAGRKRRVQHRATRRKMGGSPTVPQLGISPIVKMA